MPKVITNADDLGISPTVNSAIFELMGEGLVTSATIMANAPATEEACRDSAHFRKCSFGVHLNLTEFQPLTGASEICGLMASGRGDGLVRNPAILRPLRQAIFWEWSAQVERVRSLGVAISHLDSHHHVHTIPALFPVLKAVQKQFAIYRVRISRNLYPPAQQPGFLLRLKKAMFNTLLRAWGASATTDFFTDLAGFHANSGVLARDRGIEIMLHPGGVVSQGETQQLRSTPSAVAWFRASLVSYLAV